MLSLNSGCSSVLKGFNRLLSDVMCGTVLGRPFDMSCVWCVVSMTSNAKSV